jgi:hypothetical protein
MEKPAVLGAYMDAVVVSFSRITVFSVVEHA